MFSDLMLRVQGISCNSYLGPGTRNKNESLKKASLFTLARPNLLCSPTPNLPTYAGFIYLKFRRPTCLGFYLPFSLKQNT